MPIVIGPDGNASRARGSEYVQMRESISDVARQIEDLNWLNLSNDRPTLDLLYDDRKRMLQRYRLYRRRSPLAKQGVALVQHYVLGKGVTLKANNRAMIARIVDEFWDDPVNQAVFTSHAAQKKAIDDLFTDGDLFPVLFPNTDEGTVQLGMLDAIFVEDIITDTNNNRVPLWYKVRKPAGKYDFRNGVYDAGVSTDFTYYRDWRNPAPAGGKNAPPQRLLEDGLVMHVAINKRGKFGESELASAIDWIKSHKDFMEDRASLNRAAASIAWRKKRKGGQNDIRNHVESMQSTLVTNSQRYESNPPNAAASTIVENEGTQLDWMKTDTGASNASQDERILRMMAGSGMGGIPNHYFGDEANANLATATAMELPLLKTYEDWQKLWGDFIADIVGFILDTAHEAERIPDRDDSSKYADRVTTPRQVLQTDEAKGGVALPSGGLGPGTQAQMQAGPLARPVSPYQMTEAGVGGSDSPDATFNLTIMPKSEPPAQVTDQDAHSGKVDWFVDVDFPPILAKDVQAAMTGIKALYDMLPPGNIESQKLAVEMSLNVLGENNIDQVMERLFPPDADPSELQNKAAPTDPVALMRAVGALAAGAKGPSGTTPLLPAGPMAPGTAQATLQESANMAPVIAAYRVRRLLRSAQRLDDDLAAAGA